MPFLHKYYPVFLLVNALDKTKGVAVCFSKHVSFTSRQEIGDPEGRFLLVKGLVGEQLCTIISFYAHNVGQAMFFTKLVRALALYLEGQVICGGDTNLALDLCLVPPPQTWSSMSL